MASGTQTARDIAASAIALIACILFAGIALAQVPLVSSGYDIRVGLISQDPDPVAPGQTLELRWRVENYGSTKAENLLFEVVPRYPFSLEPGASPSQRIATLVARQTGDDAATLFTRLQVDPDAIPADEEIRLRYSLDNGVTWTQLDPFDVRIASGTSTLAVESVSVSPGELVPGQEARIVLTLRNNADEVLRDIKVRLNLVTRLESATAIQLTELPFAPIGSSNERSVSSLAPGRTAEVEFVLAVAGDAASDIYRVPLSLTYVGQDGTSYATDAESTFIGLRVNSVPEYSLNIQDRAVYTAGSTGEVVLSLSNIGPGDINYLVLTLEDSEGYEVVSPRTTYLGNLEPDDFETAEFTIHVEKDAEGELPLLVGLAYKDPFNTGFERSETVVMPLYTKKEAKRLGLVPRGRSSLWTIAALAALAGGAWLLIRRRRKAVRKAA